MNIIEHIKNKFNDFLTSHFGLENSVVTRCAFELNIDEKKEAFGDINSNAALILAKELHQKPHAIAQAIIDNFSDESIEKITMAGPGFVNIYLKIKSFTLLTQQLLQEKDSFFKLDPTQFRKTINVEFVSANPTGPLHFGHGRSGIIGDVFANVARFLGHATTKEFYINDAGSQINKLAQSFKIRCQQELGLPATMLEDGYHGAYLIDLAKECVAHYGDALLEKDSLFFQDYAKNNMLEKIKNTLTDYGITFDVWFSEKTLHEDGSIHQAINLLQENGFLYQQDNALWFKSTAFGDDKDRVVQKSTGEWTYVAADIAYLLNKVERGAQEITLILGHDHHSYATRLENIRQALKLENITLNVILYQLVHIKQAGELVQMSKRTGTMITLEDVIAKVGTDVARFFYLHRKADAQLEFDLELALKKTNENPVYYVQYAYVRTKSILEKATEYNSLNEVSYQDVSAEQEDLLLIKKIVALKDVLLSVDRNHLTHLLTYYIIELADIFHRYYGKYRIIDEENVAKSRSRLALITLLRDTFALTLTILGISLPEKM